MSGSFERSNVQWQLQLWWMQFNEWVESLFNNPNQAGDRTNNGLPEIPSWVYQGVFWGLLAVLAGWLLWQLYQLLSPYLPQVLRWQPGGRSTKALTPKEKEMAIAQWLTRSRQAQQQGNYREACRALYMATLQHLNDRELIRQEPSRTDGEYIRLLTLIDRPHPYQLLVQTHEQLHFSSTEISQETCDRCWQAYEEISRISSPS